MKIVSYNVNGIRAAFRKGMEDWIAEENPDIICIQETKARPTDLDLSALNKRGYRDFWYSADKKGYSGVLILTRERPDEVIKGMSHPLYDSEGRVIRMDIGAYTFLNGYFPSGTTGDERQAVKMQFLDDFSNMIEELKKTRPHLIVAGDYNIAHTPQDIHDPVRNKNTSGFKPEERAWMDQWFGSGFTDPYRALNPDKIEYSWWSYRAASRKRNKGWRIDYISVSDSLKDKIISAHHANEAVHSDHCPVVLNLDL